MAARRPTKKRSPAKPGSATKKKAPIARSRPVPRRVEPASVEPAEAAPSKTFPIEVDPARVEEALGKVRDQLQHWANKGRYTKVRFKFRGKSILPDIPIAAVVAFESMTFYWSGLLRALAVNIAGRALFDVELVNDSEKRVVQGKEALLVGDLDRAIDRFREAIAMQSDSASAHLNLGVALKLKGDLAGARSVLERARLLGDGGPITLEADKILGSMPTANPAPMQLVAPWRAGP